MENMKLAVSLKAATSKKALDIVLLDLRGFSNITDYFLIVSGNSDRHVQSIAEAILENMKREGHRPLGTEGLTEGKWVLLDYDELIIHVFYEPIRRYYDLEGLWSDAPRLPLEE